MKWYMKTAHLMYCSLVVFSASDHLTQLSNKIKIIWLPKGSKQTMFGMFWPWKLFHEILLYDSINKTALDYV